MSLYKVDECEEQILQRKEGWIKKKSKGLFSTWKTKYLVLVDKRLKMYSNSGGVTLKKIIDFDKVSCILKVEESSNPI